MNTGSALARFTITLSQAVTEPVQVDWFTSDGTAKAGVDYAANKGTVTFSPGETAKTVDILVYGRAVGSEDRNFFVEMLPPTNAILGASIGECIITVDTSGSTPVTAIIVPTGPVGPKGDPGEDGVSPDPAEIAEEVAPLIDVGATTLTAEGTEALSKPDATTVKAVARRVAYAAAAKIATTTLADGDNLLTQADLTGDTLDFTASGLIPRVLHAGAFSEPLWSIDADGKLLIKSATAGDELYVTQYDFTSSRNPFARQADLVALKADFEGLSSGDDGKGDAMIAVKQPFTGATKRTQHDKNVEQVSVKDFGAKGDGATDDSGAFSAAISALPNGGRLQVPAGSYVVSNVTLTKGIRIVGEGFSQGSTALINNHATNPTLSASDINNVFIDGIYFDASVTRTTSANGFLSFTRCHRVTVQNCFFWEYFLAVSYDGGTEINFDTCEYFTTKNGVGSGGMWFGKNNYTGSVNIVNCYFKADDAAVTLPQFGVRFDYVDVAYVDGSTTIIRHGNDVMITPDGIAPNGQTKFAHLIKIIGGILDTAGSGLFVQPANGADAEVELVGCYSAAMANAAWVFDGTLGKVTATITGGQVFSCSVSGIDVFGANATVFINGTRFANNQIGLHVTNNATVYAEGLSFGDWDNTSGNQYPYAIDSTAKGHLKSPTFRNNFNPGSNASATFDVCDTWLEYSPSITPVGGTLGSVTVASSRYKISDKSVEYEVAFQVSDNAASGGLVISLPRPPRTHLVGCGRNITAGPMLQCAADPGNTSMLLVQYNNAHPVVAAGNVLVARAIYEIL